MDIGQVILAHVNWRKRFYQFLEGHEQLDADVVEADDQCEFGQWLRSAGEAYRDYPEYKIAVERHREFHRVAAQTVRLAGTLPPSKAIGLVSLHSAFTHASTECVAALCSFREVVDAEQQRRAGENPGMGSLRTPPRPHPGTWGSASGGSAG